ncbi:MAG: hypothetical protein ACKOYN_03820 [Planctomycetota bacterium]
MTARTASIGGSLATRIALGALALAAFAVGGCRSVPTGPGAYLVTITDVSSGKPVEGVDIMATGAGTAARGEKAATGTTDEDGQAVIAFGNWGAVDVQLAANGVRERWLVSQDRVAVNGGKASKDPTRLLVGGGKDGGVSVYKVAITRIEKGTAVDN